MFNAPLLIATLGTLATGGEVAAAAEAAPVQVTVVGQRQAPVRSATKTDTPLIDVPQAVSIISEAQIDDQAMRSIADVLRYVPGSQSAQGEGHRDQIVLRGNNSTADFFVDGIRDDVQYYRGLYNLDRVEVLKGPNAMIFGRGGGGGVVNRVSKQAIDGRFAHGAVSADHHGAWFAEGDVNLPLGGSVNGRLNAVYEEFDSFRDHFEGHRIGINPTVAVAFGADTSVELSYEFAKDGRVVDRGVPSDARGGTGTVASPVRPLNGFDETFFGSIEVNESDFDAHVGRVAFEHRFSDAAQITSRLLYGDYDKRYRNLFPATAVTLSGGVAGFGVEAYDDGTRRQNLISQTDLVFSAATGPISHKLLAGFEYSDQRTDNFRFNGLFANPTAGGPNVVRRRVNLTDPFVPPPVVQWSLLRSNETRVKVAAIYAQDQVSIGKHFDIIAGLRFDRFEIDAHNLVSGARFGRTDKLWSPRLGLVFKPIEDVSLYAAFSRSFLPQSGDQFTSLDLVSEALEPERFTNFEIGAKWQPRPGLDLTLAAYRLDRTNTRENLTPTVVVLSGEQRSKGVELEVRGEVTSRLAVSGGLAFQDVEVRKSVTPGLEGRKAPLVPEFQASLWGRYDFTDRFGAGLGVYHQSKTFASISNAVQLAGYTRLDAAGFVKLGERLSLQLNVENLLGKEYFSTAHNDNNITPGAPRTVRATVRFGL